MRLVRLVAFELRRERAGLILMHGGQDDTMPRVGVRDGADTEQAGSVAQEFGSLVDARHVPCDACTGNRSPRAIDRASLGSLDRNGGLAGCRVGPVRIRRCVLPVALE